MGNCFGHAVELEKYCPLVAIYTGYLAKQVLLAQLHSKYDILHQRAALAPD